MTIEKLEKANDLKRQIEGIDEQLHIIADASINIIEERSPNMFIEFDLEAKNKTYGVRLTQNRYTADKDLCKKVAMLLRERLQEKRNILANELEAL